jgi:hypothetical protein
MVPIGISIFKAFWTAANETPDCCASVGVQTGRAIGKFVRQEQPQLLHCASGALTRPAIGDGVRKNEVTGSNSYSKMVARYRREDLLAVHAVWPAAVKD